MDLIWLKSRYQEAASLPEALEEDPFSYLFQNLVTAYIPIL